MLPPPPPGWYPDPAGSPALRWWDGQRWSGDLHPDQARSVQTAGLGAPAPAQGPTIPARAAWWALVGLLIGEVAGGLLAAPVALATHSDTGAAATLFGELGLWAGMIGSCLFVSRRYGTGSLRRDFRLGWRPRDLLIGAGVAVLGIIVSDIVASVIRQADRHLSGTNTQVLTNERGDGVGFIVVTLIAALGAPFFEELFFRGLIRTALSARLGTTGAIWAQAGLFGLAHYEPSNGLGNISVMLAIASLGVLLGYTAQRTGRLGANMVAHGLFNTVAAIAIFVN